MAHTTIYVLADHCTDDTAARAEAAGATVLLRQHGPRGKTYTIAWGIETLTQRGIKPDLYVIVDATTRVEPRFLAAMTHCWQQGEDIIACRATVSAANQQWYARCLAFMLVHRNLQGWCRERLGLSAWLEGRGMAYSREYIERFGWQLALPTGLQASHPTEDWRHGVRVVEEGYRVAFAPDAIVVSPLRNTLVEATKQGARWERGRLINALTHALRLLRHGVQQRKPIKVVAALDATQPPVALLGAFAACIALLALTFPSLNRLGVWVFAPFMLVCLYGFMVAVKGYREGLQFFTILWAPLYVIWRCISFILGWVFFDRFSFFKPLKNSNRRLS
jgi:cellulose synthase/poly-beta-1,6-N-acetylglucosamine synthase-like glycosyltransferase